MPQGQQGQLVHRHGITYEPGYSLYGGPAVDCCPPLFNTECTDGSIGLLTTGGDSAMAMSWFGLNRARAKRETQTLLHFLSAVRSSGATAQPGVPAAICAETDCVVSGDVCELEQTCFGLIETCGDPMINGGNSLPYCVSDPRWTIAGDVIANDEQWHEAVVSDSQMQRVAYHMLWGYRRAADNPLGHYGLWSLFNQYGDDRDFPWPDGCPSPHVLDWNGGTAMSSTPQAGITLDGAAIGEDWTTNLFMTLRSLVWGYRRRIQQTAGIMAGDLVPGDIAILAPWEAFECLMNAAVCFTECNNDFIRMDSDRATAALNTLRNSGVGYGSIVIDGLVIPLIPYDPRMIVDDGTGPEWQGSLINDDGTFNMFMLIRGSGNRRIFFPEYNDLSDGTNPTRDNGFVQIYADSQKYCVQMGMRTEWRWMLRGACFQTLIRNVTCDRLFAECDIDLETMAVNC